MKTMMVVNFALVCAWLAFCVTQIALPLINGTATFPIFRSKRREVESQMTQATENVDLSARLVEIKKMNDAAARTANKRGRVA